MFSNNEIFLKSSLNGYGLSTGTGIAFLYNSIYMESNGASALYLKGDVNSVNYNNLIAGANADVAIRIEYPDYVKTADIDYNNYFSVGNIGRLGGNNLISLHDWQTAMTKDLHSVSVLPSFIDTAVGLKYADSSTLYCPVSFAVRKDIQGEVRTTPTAMGAYGLSSNNLDMELTAVLDIPSGMMTGQTISPRVVITNTGLAKLDSAVISWEYDGVVRQVKWNGKVLSSVENDTLSLGTLSIVHSGMSQLSIYIASVNTGVTDMNQKNDTLRTSFYACDSALNGSYKVGNVAAAFSSLTEAVTNLQRCGVSGNVQFIIQDGIYTENIDLTGLKTVLGTHKLDIVSAGNTADSVIFRPIDNKPVVLIKNSTNITLNAITVDATISKSYGIEFADTATGITVSGCRFFADTVSAANGNPCIYRSPSINSTDLLSDIVIEDNVICGGLSGIDITVVSGDGIKINRNLVYKQYEAAILLRNTAGTNNEIHFNTIRSGMINRGTTWSGITLQRANVTLNGNKIHQQDTSVQHMKGILVYGDAGLISNNEIIGFARYEARGIEFNASAVNLLHNSIYLYGQTLQCGIFTNSSTSLKIHRNNIVLESNMGYPVSLIENNTSPVKDINLNNYYAPAFIGRIATDISTLNPLYVEYRQLNSWKVDVPNDVASVQVAPKFIDASQSLEMSDYNGMYCAALNDVPNDINNTARTNPTAIGAYGLSVLTAYDLSLQEIVAPANGSSVCAADYVPVRYALFNAGTKPYDFTQDTVYLHFKVSGMKGDFDTTVLLTTGVLSILEADTVELMNFLDVSFAGDYHITAWISSANDTVYTNDTLRMTYRTNKIALPYEEDFSTANTPELVIDNKTGTQGWHIVQGGDALITPNYGTGMFLFDASHGSISSIRIGQIELERTAQPKLEFWYAHDNNEPNKRDQMVVKVSWNGGASENVIYQIMRYDPAYTTPDWKKYTVDLSPYIDSACVVVTLEAYSYGSVQHLDQITVTSNQNLALNTILVSDYALCNLNGKKVSLILENTTNQKVNYATTPTNIHVKISGVFTKDTTIVLSGTMEGGQKDTMLIVDNLDFKQGAYNMIAFLSSPTSDFDRRDDTTKRTIVINPSLSVNIDRISGGSTNCLSGELSVFQTITLKNTGTMDIFNLGVIMQIDTGQTGDPLYFELKENYPGTIKPDSVVSYQFTSAYIVPWNPVYQVDVIAYMLCDSAWVRGKFSIQECTDMNDIILTSIDNPTGNTSDKAGSSQNITLTLRNRSDITIFSQVLLTALIEDTRGNKQKITEVIPALNNLAVLNHTFSTPFVVPDDTLYSIVVFVDKQLKDIYQHNDTIRTTRKTDYKVGMATNEQIRFSMEQNIPNPAKNATLIHYSVPFAGEITLKVYAVNGISLYERTISATFGVNTVELNTSDFSAGIYYYTMEFNNQRIVKKMNIIR
jgi:hypothetical protein